MSRSDSRAVWADDRSTPLDKASSSILQLQHHRTGIPVSHFAHPGYEDLAFTYDSSVAALMLEASGRREDARRVLDPFHRALQIPMEQLLSQADTNDVFGILKLFAPLDRSKPKLKAIINSISCSAPTAQASGANEFVTTPGPMAWLMLAMEQVDQQRYGRSIETLRQLLLGMQDSDGGIRDGDRMPHTVHTEPHVDAACALLVSARHPLERGEPQESRDALPWPEDAERAWTWFRQYAIAVTPERAVIYQGVGPGGRQLRPATDTYTWTMASPFGDRIAQEYGIGTLKRLTQTLLHFALVEVTWTAPNATVRTSLLLDFTDPNDRDVMGPVVNDNLHPDYGVARGGYHPAGSPEWTGGAILAFQKNAVRCYRAWDAGARQDAALFEQAVWFKTLAIALEQEVQGVFYEVRGMTLGPYATGQNIATGFGWRTPLYSIITSSGQAVLQGGSLVSAWSELPLRGLNPFLPGDTYRVDYDKIPSPPSLAEARRVLRAELRHPPFEEPVLQYRPWSAPELIEPRVFVGRMWDAFNRGKYLEAVQWAERTVLGEPRWAELAQRDNRQKRVDVGNIIAYPWGRTYADNAHPLHDAIGKYRLLNEVGAAMAGAAMANYRLSQQLADAGDPVAPQRYREAAKFWLRRMILEDALHQVAVTMLNERSGQQDLIYGYWNAIISWWYYPEVMSDGKGLHTLMTEVLEQLPAEGLLQDRDYFLPSPKGVTIVRSEAAAPSDASATLAQTWKR